MRLGGDGSPGPRAEDAEDDVVVYGVGDRDRVDLADERRRLPGLPRSVYHEVQPLVDQVEGTRQPGLGRQHVVPIGKAHAGRVEEPHAATLPRYQSRH